MAEDGFILVPHLGPGGTSRDSVEWANRFKEKGFNVPVLALRASGAFRKRLHPGVPFEQLNLSGTFSGLPALLRRLRKSHSAFILTNCLSSACAVVLFRWLGLFAGRLVFVESINPSQALRSSWKSACGYRLIHRNADAIVHISQFGYHYVRHLRQQTSRSHYIPNIVPVAKARRKQGKSSSLRLLAVGRLDVIKGYARLIEAMPEVIRAFPDATLRICGDGDQRQQLKDLVIRLGLSSKIELVGHVEDISVELRAADIFLLTSYFEGMPNALIEALAVGVPVAGTSCGGSVRRLLLGLGAGKALIEDGPDFSQSLLRALVSATDGSINWADVDARFLMIHDDARNFDTLMNLCLNDERRKT